MLAYDWDLIDWEEEEVKELLIRTNANCRLGWFVWAVTGGVCARTSPSGLFD